MWPQILREDSRSKDKKTIFSFQHTFILDFSHSLQSPFLKCGLTNDLTEKFILDTPPEG